LFGVNLAGLGNQPMAMDQFVDGRDGGAHCTTHDEEAEPRYLSV
jgi:hypothetical protein